MSQNNELPMLPIVGYLTEFDGGTGFWDTESEALSYCDDDMIPEALVTLSNARAALAAQAGKSEPAQMFQNMTIVGMTTAAHAIDFWDEYFDYVNSDPKAHSDMLKIAKILRNPGDEIARLRGEIGVICDLMDQALDVMQTVTGDDDDEDRKILRLRAKMASAINHFLGRQLLSAPARQPLTMSVNEFATQLKCAGWKDTADAQWDGLAKLMKELGVTHD